MTMSWECSGSRYEVSTRSQPPTSAPQAAAIAAYADRPAPPMPTNQSRRPSSGRKLDQLFRDHARCIRFRERTHPLRHALEPVGLTEQRARKIGHAAELGLGHADRTAAALEVLRVQALVIGRRERIRNEDR